tara:strand:+ start:978 stop:1823 length:846 start_codon:yes stop_codon:yes gene_type:complete
MRRSFKDAIVGFSLLGGILVFVSISLWLKGVRFSSKTWHLYAEFDTASGLAKRSPVSYRGILVGSVEEINFTPNSIQAKIIIDNKDLILPKPAFAKIVTNSFLGGDVQVSLETSGEVPKNNLLNATSKECATSQIICEGDVIKGQELSSLSSITSRINELLKVSNEENLIKNIANSIDQFDVTQANLDELIYLSKREIIRAKPLIEELTKAAIHLNNILKEIDNPETLRDIKLTTSQARLISEKIYEMSDNVQKIFDDKELAKAMRDLTIGLSKFMNDIYP